MWLLDTNVLSELRRARPEPKVVSFLSNEPLDRQFISIVTFAEIRYGIERTGDETRRRALRDWLDVTLRPMFERRTLGVTEDVMLRWRSLVESGRKARYTYSQPDLIIAATAQCHGLTVVTRNTKDFQRAEVPFANPWV